MPVPPGRLDGRAAPVRRLGAGAGAGRVPAWNRGMGMPETSQALGRQLPPRTAPPATTAWASWAPSLATPTAPAALRAAGLGGPQAAVLVAGLLGRLEPGVVRAHAGRGLLLDPVRGDLGVGHVGNAVLAHAPGERQRPVALLGGDRGGLAT